MNMTLSRKFHVKLPPELPGRNEELGVTDIIAFCTKESNKIRVISP